MAERTGDRNDDVRDLLAAYEMGLLDEADQARFEAVLAEDPDLLDELYESAPDALLMAGDPGRFAEAARAGLQASGSPAPSWGQRLRALWRPRVVLPTVAAALAVLAVVLAPGGGASLADLAVTEPLSVVRPAVRANEPAADTLLRAALDDYVAGNWDTAADGLRQAMTAGGDQWRHADQAHLYLGSALLLARRTDEAVPALETAADSGLLPVREQAA